MRKINLIIALIAAISLTFGSCKNQEITKDKGSIKDSVAYTNNNTSNTIDNNTTTVNDNVGKVVQLTDESFKVQVFDYNTHKDWKYQGQLPCIIDFYADWCRPCKMIAPIMEELAKTYKGKVLFYRINVDENPEVSQVFGIQSIPAVLFVPKNGQPQMSVGAMPKESYVKAIEETLIGK